MGFAIFVKRGISKNLILMQILWTSVHVVQDFRLPSQRVQMQRLPVDVTIFKGRKIPPRRPSNAYMLTHAAYLPGRVSWERRVGLVLLAVLHADVPRFITATPFKSERSYLTCFTER